MALGAVALGPASAAPAGAPEGARPSDLSAQELRRTHRPRIRVTPAHRLLYRECEGWLAQEWRPSGPVLVPRRHCWWVRG